MSGSTDRPSVKISERLKHSSSDGVNWISVFATLATVLTSNSSIPLAEKRFLKLLRSGYKAVVKKRLGCSRAHIYSYP